MGKGKGKNFKPISTMTMMVNYTKKTHEPMEPKILGPDELLDDLVAPTRLCVAAFIQPDDFDSETVQTAIRELLMKPEFRDNKRVIFVEINVLDHRSATKQFMVSTRELPTVLFFKNDREMRRLESVFSSKQFKKNCRKQLLSPPYPKIILPGASKPAKELTRTEQQALDPRNQISDAERARCQAIVNRARVMLLIKGNMWTTEDEDSQTGMRILHEGRVNFQCFDVLADNGVDDILMKFALYKVSFPHVYVNGVMIGGLSSLEELEIVQDIRRMFGAPEFAMAGDDLEREPKIDYKTRIPFSYLIRR